ncbi:unnamed protein product, partial [Polarella glacialis]
DKNKAPEAEEKFREVSLCYEELSNPSRAGARGGGRGNDGGDWAGGAGMAEYDARRAFRTFEDLFGDVHRRWQPGMTVSGTIVSAGKKVKITIYPDGATEESEGASSGPGGYSSLYSSDGRGSTSIHIEGDISQMIVDMVVSKIPPWASAIIPVLSLVLMVLCNPGVLCAGCCYCCCFRPGSQK